MVILRNYRFDLLHEGHNQQPYIWKIGVLLDFGHLTFHIKIWAHPIIDSFFTFVGV